MPSSAGNNYIKDGMLPTEYVPMRRDLRQYYLWVDELWTLTLTIALAYTRHWGACSTRDVLVPFRAFDFRKARDGIIQFGEECDPSDRHGSNLDIMYEQMNTLYGLEVEYWFPGGYADIAGNEP